MNVRLMAWVVLCGCGKPAAQPLEVTVIDAGCSIVVEAWGPQEAAHVPVGSELGWDSNPPSSGAHFPAWAAYQAFTTAVPRGFYVHNLEHGSVVLLFNCALSASDSSSQPASLRAQLKSKTTLPCSRLCT